MLSLFKNIKNKFWCGDSYADEMITTSFSFFQQQAPHSYSAAFNDKRSTLSKESSFGFWNIPWHSFLLVMWLKRCTLIQIQRAFIVDELFCCIQQSRLEINVLKLPTQQKLKSDCEESMKTKEHKSLFLSKCFETFSQSLCWTTFTSGFRTRHSRSTLLLEMKVERALMFLFDFLSSNLEHWMNTFITRRRTCSVDKK